jgi:hypothetical protein
LPAVWVRVGGPNRFLCDTLVDIVDGSPTLVAQIKVVDWLECTNKMGRFKLRSEVARRDRLHSQVARSPTLVAQIKVVDWLECTNKMYRFKLRSEVARRDRLVTGCDVGAWTRRVGD